MKIRDVLELKGDDVATVKKDVSVYDCMERLDSEKIGSLLVVDEANNILGIIGLPDCIKACLKSGDTLRSTNVDAVMTKDVICGLIDDDIDEVSKLMTKNRIRHLPVVNDGKICGIISIGDVVKARLEETDVENRYLREYITGSPAE